MGERLRPSRGNEPPTGGHLPGATAIIVDVPTHALPRTCFFLVVLRLLGSLLVCFGLLADSVRLSRTPVLGQQQCSHCVSAVEHKQAIVPRYGSSGCVLARMQHVSAKRRLRDQDSSSETRNAV